MGHIYEVIVEDSNEAPGQVIGCIEQNIALNFTAAEKPPAVGSYVNVLVTSSFPNSVVGELVWIGETDSTRCPGLDPERAGAK
jgi:tRNA-2-methylthio-N6-dimethylallyladenosine synthase